LTRGVTGRDAACVADRTIPAVPAHAWAWLQRSRPVLAEVAQRLAGHPPTPAFVEGLRTRFEEDPFTRDVVIDVVAEVAFNGRAPKARPPAASWDRGLTWWAATVAGVPVEQFEARATPPTATEEPLFDPGAPPSPPARGGRVQGTRRTAATERAALAARLRELLSCADGDQVPASAVRQLLASLEDPRR
jgi:hypothetical protein